MKQIGVIYVIKELVKEFELLEEVDAILLGGSRATGVYDEKSDYDLYVYLNKPLREEVRKSILDNYCSYMEYSNQFWELEDDGILNSGIEIEMIYRDIEKIHSVLKSTAQGNVSNGYSTCFLDNIIHSKILFDKTGKLQEMKEEFKDSLNQELIQKIIDLNLPLIYDKMPAMFKQIKKAVERDDVHSINHRITAYFEIYYDILFAVNKKLHPGEKRLLTLASSLPLLPKDFVKEVDNVFTNVFHDNKVILNSLKILSISLKDLLKENGYIL